MTDLIVPKTIRKPSSYYRTRRRAVKCLQVVALALVLAYTLFQIGRASCRERV